MRGARPPLALVESSNCSTKQFHMHLALQIVTALAVGVVYYMLAMAMTVYDGVLSLMFQPIMGTILTLTAIVILLVVGLPIRRLTRLHRWWRNHWWIALVSGLVGFIMMYASWQPEFRVQVLDPELNTLIDSFHPGLAVGGWMLTIFSVLHFYPPLPWLRCREFSEEQTDD